MVSHDVTLTDLRQLITNLEDVRANLEECKDDRAAYAKHQAYGRVCLDLLAARLVTIAMRYHFQLKCELQKKAGNGLAIPHGWKQRVALAFACLKG